MFSATWHAVVIIINFYLPGLTSSKQDNNIIINLTRWLFHKGQTRGYLELQLVFTRGIDP